MIFSSKAIEIDLIFAWIVLCSNVFFVGILQSMKLKALTKALKSFGMVRYDINIHMNLITTL